MAKFRFSIPGDCVNHVKHHDKDAEFVGGSTLFQIGDDLDDGLTIEIRNISLEEALRLISEFEDPNVKVELVRQEEQDQKQERFNGKSWRCSYRQSG